MAETLALKGVDTDNEIVITRTGAGFDIEIDGQEFQFTLADGQMAELIIWARDLIVPRRG